VDDLAQYFEEHPHAVEQFQGLPITLDINPAFLKLFRATSVAGYHENVIKMVDTRARHAYETELAALFRGDTTCETDFPLRDLNGEELLYTVRLTVAPGCADDLSSVFVSLVDNTRRLREEERRRQQEARDRQAQKDESLALLAGGVAHDFNNLLVPIIGNIELAMHQVGHNEAAAGNLRRAEQAAQRAADLARQMLTYSGRGQVQSETFDLNALVREMSDLLSASLPGKVDLVTDLYEGKLGMEGDPTQLRQLVMNLVINAADAVGGEPGRVVVRTGEVRPTKAELDGAYLGAGLEGQSCSFLEVRDTGKGLDEETQKRIFEPFFSTKSAGRGLGMSVVLGIVRGHAGGLTVASRLGKGTRIRAYMPRVELEPPAPTGQLVTPSASMVREPEVEWQPTGRALFADDEPQVRRFAIEALGRIGVDVTCAVDGLEAVEIWRRRPGEFDLVILDATMPRMGGVEAMEEIRAEAADQPILLSSGYTQEGVASRAAESELCWFLPKPFGVSELTRLVTRVLAETSGKSAPEE
jgi:signal transduction histidine kinase/CheY-like chemotaxis protein